MDNKIQEKMNFFAASQGGSYASLAKNKEAAILPWNF